MLRWLLLSPIAELVRGIICVGVSLLFLFVAIHIVYAQTIENEHRITSLEVRVDNLEQYVQDEKFYHIIQILGLSGLIGETGIRLIRRKV